MKKRRHQSKQRLRNQDKSEVDHYKGLLREAEKTIRKLQQELRYYQKYEQTTVTEVEDIPETKPAKPCHECGKGFMDEFEIVGKVYGTCNVCGHRERLK